MNRTALTAAAMLLVATITVSLTGCTFTTPQETTDIRHVVDGANADVGAIGVRNAIALTAGNGTASLSMVVLNSGGTARDVRFSYRTRSGWVSQSVRLTPESMLRRGTRPGDDEMLLSDLTARPGALLEVFVDDGGSTGRMMRVPVLDGRLPDYATLLPTPGDTSSADLGAAPVPSN